MITREIIILIITREIIMITREIITNNNEGNNN